VNGFDDESRGLLEGRTKLHQEGIEKIYSLSLFYPQRHQNEGKYQKENDDSWDGISSKEEKVSYPHQSSILECHGMEQCLVVEDFPRTQNNR